MIFRGEPRQNHCSEVWAKMNVYLQGGCLKCKLKDRQPYAQTNAQWTHGCNISLEALGQGRPKMKFYL